MRDKLFLIETSENRNIICKKLLDENGYKTLNIDEQPQVFSDKIIYVFSPKTILDINIAKKVIHSSTVFAFKTTCETQNFFSENNIKFINIVDDELFAHKNALITAEGAIKIMMENTNYSFESTKALILGYGRIGKHLCNLLSSVRAKATPVITSPMEEVYAETFQREHSLNLNNFIFEINKFNVIFNTIPKQFLTKTVLENVDSNTLIIDLASSPGGTDFDAAKQFGLQTIHALSIPSSYAPKDAGRFLMERILRTL